MCMQLQVWQDAVLQVEPEEQQPQQQQPAPPAPDGARPGAPWQLKRANSVGATRLYSEPGKEGDTSSRLYFAGEAAPPACAL